MVAGEHGSGYSRQGVTGLLLLRPIVSCPSPLRGHSRDDDYVRRRAPVVRNSRTSTGRLSQTDEDEGEDGGCSEKEREDDYGFHDHDDGGFAHDSDGDILMGDGDEMAQRSPIDTLPPQMPRPSASSHGRPRHHGLHSEERVTSTSSARPRAEYDDSNGVDSSEETTSDNRRSGDSGSASDVDEDRVTRPPSARPRAEYSDSNEIESSEEAASADRRPGNACPESDADEEAVRWSSSRYRQHTWDPPVIDGPGRGIYM
ncbi:hypothetical protein VFPPC_16264 [Pochonia chlamydosporia 170]|uniref:Uncharacterized protein n=1 Tax=Pochonia chlamydosporia 170 TaxID=1380566 RepID=A0A179FIJ2_METCM|nr:hypothetical protein VFPPC_16264 [Pochonia chlamydosporia 170]OAQ64829.1 hypothetical protein VFPPC_16264 [Pochonia chlamydosporia 170]